MESHPFFIDRDGKAVEYEDIASHIGIALRYLEEHPELKKEFEESGIKFANDFLIQRKGLIQVTDEVGNGYYNRKLVFSASMMTTVQKELIMRYREDGYKLDNVDRVSASVVKRFHEGTDR